MKVLEKSKKVEGYIKAKGKAKKVNVHDKGNGIINEEQEDKP